MERRLEKATRQHTRDHNIRLVFRAIYDHSEMSRADLARFTGLTRTTVSHVVAELIERGLVEEIGAGLSSGGRVPILLQVADDSRQIIALALEEQVIRGALVNLRGVIGQRVSVPLRSYAVPQVLDQLAEVIQTLQGASASPALGIGVSVPGLIDTSGGVVRTAVNYGWLNVPLRELLQSRYRLPVHVGNEVRLTALAEYTFGSGSATGNLIVINAGVGIGAGIVLGGTLFYGDGYGAGEIGHVAVVEHGELCKCGNRGCLESVANSLALVRQAGEIARAHPESLLWQFSSDPDTIDLETVRLAVDAGDLRVRRVVQTIGQWLGAAIAQTVGLLNIERVVLTGPLAHLGEVLAEAVLASMRQRALPLMSQATEIQLRLPDPDAAILGVSALLLYQELGLAQFALRQTVGREASLVAVGV